MQSKRRVTVALLPNASRVGTISPGRRTSIPATTIGLVEKVSHGSIHTPRNAIEWTVFVPTDCRGSTNVLPLLYALPFKGNLAYTAR